MFRYGSVRGVRARSTGCQSYHSLQHSLRCQNHLNTDSLISYSLAIKSLEHEHSNTNTGTELWSCTTKGTILSFLHPSHGRPKCRGYVDIFSHSLTQRSHSCHFVKPISLILVILSLPEKIFCLFRDHFHHNVSRNISIAHLQ